jgi:hypothetical protein
LWGRKSINALFTKSWPISVSSRALKRLLPPHPALSQCEAQAYQRLRHAHSHWLRDVETRLANRPERRIGRTSSELSAPPQASVLRIQLAEAQQASQCLRSCLPYVLLLARLSAARRTPSVDNRSCFAYHRSPVPGTATSLNARTAAPRPSVRTRRRPPSASWPNVPHDSCAPIIAFNGRRRKSLVARRHRHHFCRPAYTSSGQSS